MKQTIEEAAREYASCEVIYGGLNGLSGLDSSKYEPFIDGAKWQAKQSPWISVKERLPDEGYPVLIRLKDGVVRIACYDIDEDSNMYFWNDNYAYETFRAWDVTHWMPIPKFN